MTEPLASAPEYHERLHVPLRWWVQGAMFVASLWLAMVVALPGLIAWPATVLMLALLGTLLGSYGSPTVVVADGTLRVGRARIEARHLGAVRALDAEETRRTAGRDADVRAYLVLRPYLKRAVRVEISDAADPAPYWLVCTRRPDELAGAIASLTSG